LRVLHSFASNKPDGILPNAQLVEGRDGGLYGTAGLGGNSNRGTIYRLDPADLGPVNSISVRPNVIKSGQSAKGKVTLFDPAPGGGLLVTLGAEAGPVSVPDSVIVPAGMNTATFKVKTFKIGAQNISRIYASVDGQGTRTVVTVDP